MPKIPFLSRWLPNNEETGLRSSTPAKRAKKKEMEFVVIGLGRFGSSVAKALTQYGHNVLALDDDKELVQELAHELPHVVSLDATNIDALRQVGVGDFNTAICCIGSDFEANLLACVLVRELGVQRVVAKARTQIQRKILLQIGADEVILPEEEAGIRLARRVSAIDFVDYLSLGNNVGVVELVVPERYHGQTLVESAIRNKYHLTVIAIRRQGYVIASPGADTRFEPGDDMLVLGAISDAERLV